MSKVKTTLKNKSVKSKYNQISIKTKKCKLRIQRIDLYYEKRIGCNWNVNKHLNKQTNIFKGTVDLILGEPKFIIMSHSVNGVIYN